MKVLLIHQYFKKPEEGSGIRTWHIAHRLAEVGHEVEVLSGHNELSGPQKIGPFKVHYFKVAYDNEFGFLRRIWSFLLFVFKCRQYIRRHHDYDLSYILSTPLTTGLIGLFAKKKYGLPYCFEVGDLWPMAPIQMGVIKSEIVKERLYQMEEKIYQNASELIALSTGIKEVMDYVVDYKKPVHTIPNMSECDFFYPVNDFPTEFSHIEPFVIGYQGAIGRANHLEYLLDLAQKLEKEQLPAKVRIMGEGSEKERLRRLSNGQKNVEWVNPGGKSEVKNELDLCHAVYISYARYQVLETGSPNKFFDGLAAGKLIICNFNGWIKELIERKECGFSYQPNQPENCASLLIPFLRSPALLRSYQENSRNLAEDEFNVSLLTDKVVEIVSNHR